MSTGLKKTSLRAARWPGAGLLILLLVVICITPAGAADDVDEIRDLAESGRTYEALSRLEPLLEAEPDWAEGLLLKGILLTRLGRVDEAKEIFLGLVKSSPELPEPYINLAALYAGAGDYDRAVRILKRALATHPSYLAAYENLTKVYGKLASEAYRRALGDEAETDEEAVELVLVEQIYPRATPATEVATADEAQPAEPAPAVDSLAADVFVPQPEHPTGGDLPVEVVSPAVAEADEIFIPVEEATTVEIQAGAEPATDADRGAQTAPDLGLVPEMIDEWALAWTEQNVEDYLGYYSREFAPTNGLSLEGWEAMRRGRLTGPGFISISVEDLEVEEEGPGKAEARFIQLYESNVLQDSCVKLLSLVWEDGGWKIAAEHIDE